MHSANCTKERPVIPHSQSVMTTVMDHPTTRNRQVQRVMPGGGSLAAAMLT
jgi:hypothetical protein